MQYPLLRALCAQMLDLSFIGTAKGYQPMQPSQVPLADLGTPAQLAAAESALAADSSLHGRYFTDQSCGYEHPATDLVLDNYCRLVGLM